MIGRCEECRFWKRDEPNPEILGEYRECLGISDADCGSEAEPDIAYSYGMNWGGSGFRTKAGFGCVLFESKAKGSVVAYPDDDGFDPDSDGDEMTC